MVQQKRNQLARAGLAKKARGKQAEKVEESRQYVATQLRQGTLDARLLARGLAKFLDSVGECQRSRPFQPLFPVYDDEGLRYCCTHDPRHCTKPIVG
ncbi:hypothetical protein ACWGCK_17060 [Streptomyces virginiae]